MKVLLRSSHALKSCRTDQLRHLNISSMVERGCLLLMKNLDFKYEYCDMNISSSELRGEGIVSYDRALCWHDGAQ